jgi:endonuclease G
MIKKLLRYLFIIVLTVPAQQDSLSLAEHLAMGNPNNASALITSPQNYLMIKRQYVHSYNRFLGIPNWVAWHTDNSWLGEMQRSNDFRADTTVPASWYRVSEKSYRKSGYDRGHMCPSGDRTNTAEDNSATFFMTNMIPQAPNNNQGPWAALEIYCRELVKQGNELYIYCGGEGSKGFIDSGRVQIPEQTWKAVLVLESGENDLRRVTPSARMIAVVMPNDNSLISKKDDWKLYRVSVDDIEVLTGFDLFSRLPEHIQSVLERTIDSE